MKNLLLVIATLTCLNSNAQSSKDDLYAKIESSYAWLNYQMLETYATINLTEEQWAWALKNENAGLSPINALGGSLANFYEVTESPRLTSDCRYKKTQDCMDRINDVTTKIYVVMNAQNMKKSEISTQLGFKALSTIAGFIGDNNLYGTKAGWKPRTKSTKFILNIDNGTAQPKVSWSADGSVATITMFVGTESPDWNDNLLKRLHAGK